MQSEAQMQNIHMESNQYNVDKRVTSVVTLPAGLEATHLK